MIASLVSGVRGTLLYWKQATRMRLFMAVVCGTAWLGMRQLCL